MTTTYQVPTAGTALSADRANIENSLEALRSGFSGTSRPTSPAPVAGQKSYDTTTLLDYLFDGSTWSPIFLKGNRADRIIVCKRLGAVSGAGNYPIFAANVNLTVEKVKLISDTTTTSTGGDNWGFQVRNVTAAVNLRSATFSTNGSDFTANVVKDLGVDQNLATVATNDVIRLEITETGTATSIADLTVQLECVPR